MKAKRLNFLPPGLHGCQHSLNILMSISLNTLKLHNDRLEELIQKLDDNFGWKPVHPTEKIESIMYRAGQASVIDYIKSIEEDEI